MANDDRLLNRVYQIDPNLDYEIKDEQVIIYKKENHLIQRFLRKCSMKIPETSTITLDDYGSFLFQQIDGKKSIFELGKLLAEHDEEASTHLYERLALYLEYLAFEKKYIYELKISTK